jgi:outer membrane protein assembly factor BamC
MADRAASAAMEMDNVRPIPAAVRAAVLPMLGAAVLLGGCSNMNGLFGGDSVDYRSAAGQARPLEVPPDLTQLSRTAPPAGGTVSASQAAAATAAARSPAAPGAQTVAITVRGEVRVEREGDQRWLVVPMPAEQLWPQVAQFWRDAGFTLVTENAEAGVMETDWRENRAKLPDDLIRSTLGRIAPGLYDTGYRDRFRTRLERVPGGSTEIYVTHRGLEEVYTDARREMTGWQPRPREPELESEFLARMLVRMGTPPEQAQAVVAAAPERAPRARVVAGQPAATLEVDETFDRAWRRVGLALDRSGFSVEDRDRTAGLYFVRYVDPKALAQEDPGFFARLFGSGTPAATPVRYRIQVAAAGDRTRVAVLDAAGAPDTSESAQRMIAVLVGELR